MFYSLIQQKRDLWFQSDACAVKSLVDYICQQGKMRDAQIEAIRTYLYLKIACYAQPLWQLFVKGTFSSLDLSRMPLMDESRRILGATPAAVALLEYAMLKDRKGKQLAPELEAYIKEHAGEIDYQEAFRQLFYGVDYADYLFSLPMGAGKTFLMSAFIYLDLYLASQYPEDPRFAHNFIILAPSGLKSSIVPSLKKMRDFDPTWVIPEPMATKLRNQIQWEVLEEQKSDSKSNQTRNPNVRKLLLHQPLEDMMGLVAITNAEKVILANMDKKKGETYIDHEDFKQDVENELREVIGRIPHLGIFIDEVHHAADGDIKLRQVVNGWARRQSVNSVIGFSGTPYLEKADPVTLGNGHTIKNVELSNIVYHYPLIDGVGNFLKQPEIMTTDEDSATIINRGLCEFFDRFLTKIYADGTCAKVAIYCPSIEALEEEALPLATQVAQHYGLNPAEVILRYHKGNKQYKMPEGADAAFAGLDSPTSHYRIIMLVGIGKEGWDCRSLTGVILSQKGSCPNNMVLQTSCRCMRQVVKGQQEEALIWLNSFNADKLNAQLKKEQNITLKEFGSKRVKPTTILERYSRMQHQKVPPIDFYQLKVSYNTIILEEHPDVSKRLRDPQLLVAAARTTIFKMDLEGNRMVRDFSDLDLDQPATFSQWLQQIVKESFHTLQMADLKPYEQELHDIFARITMADSEGMVRYIREVDQERVRSLIRLAFCPKRDFEQHEEVIGESARLLKVESLTPTVEATDADIYYPEQQEVKEILKADETPVISAYTPEQLKAIEAARALGIDVPLKPAAEQHPERRKSFHYLPYHMDSTLERDYLQEMLKVLMQNGIPLELYFNGDETLTEFTIKCFSRNAGGHWEYVGRYTPDFLALSRNEDGSIRKVLIIETKGGIYAQKFASRRKFMEEEFVRQNNASFGYDRFNFLYIEENSSVERQKQTLRTIQDFFA